MPWFSGLAALSTLGTTFPRDRRRRGREPKLSKRWSKAASAGKSRQWVKLCRHDGMRQESPWEGVRQWVLILALNQWGYRIVIGHLDGGMSSCNIYYTGSAQE